MDSQMSTKDIFDQKFSDFGSKLKDHAIEIFALVIIATCTFDVTYWNSSGLKWLPFAAVGIMEGGVLWWRIQNDDAKNDIQRYLTLGMIILTWIVVGATALSDATWRAYQNNVFGITELPAWTRYIALYSVIGMALIHILAFFFHRYFDPVIARNRDWRAEQRKLEHQKAVADIDVSRHKMRARTAYWKKAAPRIGEIQGYEEYVQEFRERFQKNPEDLDPRLIDRLTSEQIDSATKDTNKIAKQPKNGNGDSEKERESIAKEILSRVGDSQERNFTPR